MIKGYFGDNIYGKGLVLLPMGFDDINKMTLVNNTKTIYDKDIDDKRGNFTIHEKEILMKQ
ncbi:MAG: hypothetical protein ACR5KV_06905 [Wolbachia sp.]